MLASLKVEQQKPEEALQHLQASMQKWYPALQKAVAEQSGSEDEEEEEQENADGVTEKSRQQAGPDAAGQDSSESMSEVAEDLQQQLPSFEFRFETAKLLIELDDTTEAAVQVAPALLDLQPAVMVTACMEPGKPSGCILCLLGRWQPVCSGPAVAHRHAQRHHCVAQQDTLML